MKKRLMLFSLFLIFTVIVAGCGEKSQKDVTAMLEKKMEEMKGYQTEARMTLDVGKEPQAYDLEIWHKKKDYYRVVLNHDKKKQNQMILRNADGVFVLTPALNKSFRFQSEWPENSSQAYLYESLVSDILNDKDAKFKSDEKHYVFETKTNYQNNKTLPYQEITLEKSSLKPVMVKVMDQDRTPLVQVEFNGFSFDPSYDEGAFDVQRNMTGAQLDAPTMAQPNNDEFKVLYPVNLPENVTLAEEKKVETEEGERLVLTYEGEKSFTLYEEKAVVKQTNSFVSMEGEPADLGFAIGALTNHSLSWSYEGVDYHLASKDLSKEEMIEIARSVQGQAMK